MKQVLLILLAAVSFVIASVSSTIITNKIETKPEKVEEPKVEEKPKKEEKPKEEEVPIPVPQPVGPGNLNQPYYPPSHPTGPGNL